jgi:hypothetical protein
MNPPRRLVRVSSVDEEDRLMGRCMCGGDWALAFNEVALRRRSWVDHLGMRCRRCDSRVAFEFDVSDFFEARPGIWARRQSRKRWPLITLGSPHRTFANQVSTAA